MPLDMLQPKARFARPLVELDPWRARLQQIAPRHDVLHLSSTLATGQLRPIDDACAAKRV
jgi:hypothetical protein